MDAKSSVHTPKTLLPSASMLISLTRQLWVSFPSFSIVVQDPEPEKGMTFPSAWKDNPLPLIVPSLTKVTVAITSPNGPKFLECKLTSFLSLDTFPGDTEAVQSVIFSPTS